MKIAQSVQYIRRQYYIYNTTNNTQNKIQTHMNTQQEFRHTLCSQHSLMTTFVHYNQSRDKFITCGQEGEINVYSVEDDKSARRLCYTNLFGEAVVCVKWANFIAGGAVAVAGSQGKLLILRITNQCIIKQKQFILNNAIAYSLDWHQQNPELFVGTSNGQYIFIDFSKQEWLITKTLPISNSPVIVACGSPTLNEYFVATDNTLCQIQKTSDKKISIDVGSKILSVLVRNQSIDKETYITEIVTLSKKGIKTYMIERRHNKRDKQGIKQEFKQFQTIDIEEDGYEWMNWGSRQSQIVLYSVKTDPSKNNQAENKVIRSPMVFVRKLNSKYVRKSK